MKTKLYSALTLLILILLFVLQNAEIVSIRFLFWQFSLSRALLVFSIFIAGVLAGYLLGTLTNYRQRKNTPGK